MLQQEQAAGKQRLPASEPVSRSQLLARLNSQGLLKPSRRGVEGLLGNPGVPNPEAAMAAAAAALRRPAKGQQQQEQQHQEQQRLFAELVSAAACPVPSVTAQLCCESLCQKERKV